MRNKFLLLLIALFAFSSIIVQAEPKIPDNYGISTLGEEFFITYFPTDRSNINNADSVHVYLFAEEATTVRIYIPNLLGNSTNDIDTTITLVANTMFDYALPMSSVLPYAKPIGSIPEVEQKYAGMSMIVEAEDPVYCYTLLDGKSRSEGYMVIPKHSLGREYIVAASPDIRPSENIYSSSYVAIVASENSTKLQITIGGEVGTETMGGKKIGESIDINLAKGDVYIVASKNEYNDLSGTHIYADRPVAVFSGNCNAYIPELSDQAQYIIDQDYPIHSFGTKYHSFGFGLENNLVNAKVFAGDADIKCYRGADVLGNFTSKGGEINKAYASVDNVGADKYLTYSANKPISVTLYESLGKKTVPFKTNLIAQEQYENEHFVLIPTDGKYYDIFINVVFKSPENISIPEDMLLGHFVNGECIYKPLSEYNIVGSVQKIGTEGYVVAMVELAEGGAYHLKSNEPSALYTYGYGDNKSFSFTGSCQFKNNYFTEDIYPPKVKYTQNGNTLNGTVAEQKKSLKAMSGMRGALCLDYLSENIEFSIDPIDDGTVDEIDWEVKILDMSKKATAYLLFYDIAGNDTTITFEYIPEDTEKPEITSEPLVNLETRQWSVVFETQDAPVNDEIVKTGIQSIDLADGTYNCELIINDFEPCFKGAIPFEVMVIDYKQKAEAYITVTDCSGNTATESFTHIPDTTKPTATWNYNSKKDYITGKFTDLPNATGEKYALLDSIIVIQEATNNAVVGNFTDFVAGKSTSFDFSINQTDETLAGHAEVRVVDLFGNDSTFVFDFEPHVGITDENDVFRVYPNPVTEMLNIEFKSNIGAYQLTIFDINGAEVLGLEGISDGTLNINTANIAHGTYFIEVKYGNKTERATMIKK